MSKTVNVCATAVLALVLGLGMAAAQVDVGNQEGLVNVDISNVRVEIAKDINVNVSQIPVTVQAPISVAANVCEVAVNVLAEQVKEGGAECDAQSTNQALNRIVQRQVSDQR